MRAIIVTLTLAAALVAVFAGCVKRVELSSPLLFHHATNRSDIADFVRIKGYRSEMSVEILGNNKWISDSVFIVTLQIGTYRHPGFDIDKLRIEPDSVTFAVSGAPPPLLVSRSGYSDNKPYVWVTLHRLVLNLDRNELLADSVNYLPLTLTLDGYARYDGQRIPIEPVTGFVQLKTQVEEVPYQNRTKYLRK